MSDKDSCVKHMRVIMYVGWVLGVLVLLPIQLLITSIFKAYRDDIKEDGSPSEATDYQEIPNEEA